MTNLHIALACAIGAGLGFHISWKVAPAFWWVGVLIGGAGAFLIAAAPQLLGAIRHGWQRIIDDLPLGRVSLRYSVYGMVRAIILTMYLMAFVNMAMWLFSPEVISKGADSVTILWAAVWFWLSVLASCSVVSWPVSALFFYQPSHSPSRWKLAYLEGRATIADWCRRIEKNEAELAVDFRVSSGLFVVSLLLPLVLAVAGISLFYMFLKNVLRVGRFAIRFAINAFRFLHTAQPLLCFVDAGLAVVIAHLFLPSSLLGDVMAMGLGGGFAVLHFEIVSVRWLKLA